MGAQVNLFQPFWYGSFVSRNPVGLQKEQQIKIIIAFGLASLLVGTRHRNIGP